MKKKLLVIEDESAVAKQLRWGLNKDYHVSIACDVPEAERLLKSDSFPVATLDLGLPPFPDNPSQGLFLLERMHEISPNTRVIVITGNDDRETAMKAVRLGAADFCSKPIDLKVLKVILERTFKLQELEEANRQLRNRVLEGENLCGILGMSEPMKRVFEAVRIAADTDFPVLVTGSTGTGKEMAAKAIHNLSKRSNKPLVIINCGAIPETLMESELFGHEKGAFTGATSAQIGRLEQADGGTVFLDEVGELPLAMQVKLLRFLQESTIERLGGRKTIKLDVRVLAATNKDLEKAVEKGEFRQDLYYRLNVLNISLPDLKDRHEDVILLAHRFLADEAKRLKRGRIGFSSDALSALLSHNWPGNVRELQNRIRRAIATAKNSRVTAQDLGLAHNLKEECAGRRLVTIKEARSQAEKRAIQMALAATGNNISKAAKLLEVSRPTLHDLLKKHGLAIKK